MSQKVIQKNKKLTFEEICPKWSEFVNEVVDRDLNSLQIQHLEYQKGLNYESHMKCFLGEAHGWNMDYVDARNSEFCEECALLSVGKLRKYMWINSDPMQKELFEMGKQELVDHWNEVHAKT